MTSGALAIDAPPPNKKGLNLEFADALRKEAGVAVAPVGQLSDPELLRTVGETSSVDAVLVGRALLRDPYFTLQVVEGRQKDWPNQYRRAL